MRKNLRHICFFVFFIGVPAAKAQHFQFSQFYAAPTYLNPAFTGAGVCGRFTVNYRDQWTGIPGQFTTYQASLDHYVRKIKSGIGLQVLKDRAGPGYLSSTLVNALYAYELQVNKKMAARAGFNIGSVQRAIDAGTFLFGDQIENGEGAGTAETFISGGINYLDIGTGFLLYSKSFWAGAAFSHINKPNQSLLNNISPLPAEIKLHGGYKISIEEVESSTKVLESHYITFAANYKKQGKFNQVDLGVYYNKNLIVLGFWYRGIPVRKPIPAYENNDAAIFLIGMAVQRMKIGYTYDYTLSSLTNARTKGTSEISFTYQLCKGAKRGAKRRKLALISCPKF